MRYLKKYNEKIGHSIMYVKSETVIDILHDINDIFIELEDNGYDVLCEPRGAITHSFSDTSSIKVSVWFRNSNVIIYSDIKDVFDRAIEFMKTKGVSDYKLQRLSVIKDRTSDTMVSFDGKDDCISMQFNIQFEL